MLRIQYVEGKVVGSKLGIKPCHFLHGIAFKLSSWSNFTNSNIMFLRTALVQFSRGGGMEIVMKEINATVKEKQLLPR